jgi:hypothetical protein
MLPGFADAARWMRDHPDELRAIGRRGPAQPEARFARGQLADPLVNALEHTARSLPAACRFSQAAHG